MSPYPDLGPKPRLGYANSRLTRAAEHRTDETAITAFAADRLAAVYVMGGELIVLRKGAPLNDPLFSVAETLALGPALETVFLGLLDGAPRFGAGLPPQTVEALKASGKSDEQIKADENYKRCLAAFNDFSTTLAEKQSHIAENERDIDGYGKTIGDHKVQLQQLLREVDKIKEESHGAVADIITAKQEKDIADMLAGIAQDGTAQELQGLRQMRQEVKAEARISKELAGTDTKAQEAEFLEYARQSQSNAEFDSLVGLGAKAEAKPPATEKPTGLPE
jgi:hypothetical protein